MRPLVLDTVPIWTLILGFGVFFYVLLDGFDLGVGILFGLAPDTPSRNLVMNSIAPIWDGNETWLVLGGLALLAAFPLAFAIIIPAVYFPILVMLLALIFRGVAFEFRYRDAEHKTFYDYGFVYGSAIGTFAQGVVLGAFIQGFEVQGRVFAGGSFDFLTPFSILTGVALVFGYGLLGAGWLVLKTEGELQAGRAVRAAGALSVSSLPSASSVSGRPSFTRTSRSDGSPGPTCCFCRPCRSSRRCWRGRSGARSTMIPRYRPLRVPLASSCWPTSASPSASGLTSFRIGSVYGKLPPPRARKRSF
jgi:cytochrome d oxidase subunit CydB